jgi:hypothetical protein
MSIKVRECLNINDSIYYSYLNTIHENNFHYQLKPSVTLTVWLRDLKDVLPQAYTMHTKSHLWL